VFGERHLLSRFFALSSHLWQVNTSVHDSPDQQYILDLPRQIMLDLPRLLVHNRH
jgi:hypothetical protein